MIKLIRIKRNAAPRQRLLDLGASLCSDIGVYLTTSLHAKLSAAAISSAIILRLLFSMKKLGPACR